MTVTSAVAPLRFRMKAASSPLNRVLIGTRTPPAPRIERAARIHRALLGAHSPTRIPGRMPRAIMARTPSIIAVSSAANVSLSITVDDGLDVGMSAGRDADGIRDADEFLVVPDS